MSRRPNPLDLPRLLATSSSNMAMVIWDKKYSVPEAKDAAEDIGVDIERVHRAPTKSNIHFKQDRVNHQQMKQFGQNLRGSANYSTIHMSSVVKEIDRFKDLLSDDPDSWISVRTFVSIDTSDSLLTEQDVGDFYSDKTEVFDLASSGDRTLFGTHTVFLNHTDEFIENHDVQSTDVTYASRLIEIENEMIGAT